MHGVKVMFVIGELAVGGAEMHLVRLLPRLKLRGVSPMVYALSAKGPLADRLEAEGIPVRTVCFSRWISRMPRPLRYLLGAPASLLTLMVHVLRWRPSAIHMFLPAAYVLGGLVALVCRTPVRIMSRRSRNFYMQRHCVAGIVEKKLHKRMSVLLGNSRLVIQDLVSEGAAAGKVRLLYNGIPIPDLTNPDEPAAVRRELGIDSTSLVIAVTANLIPYKGHLDLLEALSAMHSRVAADWVLLCIGDDRGEGNRLAKRAKELGIDKNVQFLGGRHDVWRLLGISDFAVLPSHEEGFSNAVLEYMAAGLASVVTDVGGNAEAIVDGVCGYVVPPRSPHDMGEALLRLIQDEYLRKNMGAAARARAEQLFNIDLCTEKYLALYHALLCGSPIPSLDTDA